MDLYRYFHPHHNPRLRNVALRLQEISELRLATKELNSALKRALLRTQLSRETNLSNIEKNNLLEEQLKTAIDALDLSMVTLDEAIEAHPEDSDQDMFNLLVERKIAPGWETWSKLVSEKLFSHEFSSILKKFAK